jgi:hypothetical protein
VRRGRGVVAALVLVVAALTAGAVLGASASSPASGRTDRIVASGDTWTKIANELAPAASATDRATFARTLACRNALDANCQNDSLIAVLAAGRLVSYLPGDVPPAAPTTTQAATTTSGATTSPTTASTTLPATTTTVAPSTTTTSTPATSTSAPTTTVAPTTTTMPGQIPADQLPKGNAGSPNILIGPSPQQGGSGDGTGNFRNFCDFSHMSYDDPIAYPGQPGASHLHTFFGNTGTNAFSTAASLATTGNGTCSGGAANRSAYWVPTMLDANNKPVVPGYSLIYYKNGEVQASKVKEMPEGLRMIAGNAKATSAQDTDGVGRFMGDCGWSSFLSTCGTGQVWLSISFPQCWDGVNLDSPDHQSHMAYAPWPMGGCPASHPVALPQLEVNVFWNNNGHADTTKWHLASDSMVPGAKGGQTFHADFFEGWNDSVRATWTQECVVEGRDCTRGLGNATMLLDPPNFNYED